MLTLQKDIAKNIPERISDAQILLLLKKKEIDHRYIHFFKKQSNISDEDLSSWLDMNVKTFRNYKKKRSTLKKNHQEHLILLLSLYRHGIKVFGSQKLFSEWLNKGNFFLDGEEPIRYLNTVTGIRFIDDRLTAIEFGDNV